MGSCLGGGLEVINTKQVIISGGCSWGLFACFCCLEALCVHIKWLSHHHPTTVIKNRKRKVIKLMVAQSKVG
jgi:hypothetical protein